MPNSPVMWRVMRAETVTTATGPVVMAGRSRDLLLLLLLHPNERVSTERLAEMLWGENPPVTAGNSIARFVVDLRRALGPSRVRIQSGGGGYRVVVRDGELDWDLATAALASARQAAVVDDDQCGAFVATALALAGSDTNSLLLGLDGATLAVRCHEELRLEILEVLIALQYRRGCYGELIGVLESAIHASPYNEALWRHLMVALHRSGRTTEALRAYQRLRTALAAIGVRPSDETTRLEAEILGELGPEPTQPAPVGGAPTAALVAAAAAWSWAHTDALQQSLLAQLSVFDGGWTCEAAQAVCGRGGSLSITLDELVVQGRLTRVVDRGSTRYDMSRPLRGHAAEHLATRNDGAVLRQRLADWMRQSTEKWSIAELHNWHDPIAALTGDWANLNVALGHLAATHQYEELVWLAVRFFGVWADDSRSNEAIEWLEPYNGHPAISSAAASATAAMLMHAYREQDQRNTAIMHGLVSLELANGQSHDWLPAVAGALSVLAAEQSFAYSAGDLQELTTHHATNSPSVATNLAIDSLHRGEVAMASGAYDQAAHHFQAAQRLDTTRGRIRDRSEFGEVAALSHNGHQEQARDVLNAWTPEPDTNRLHPTRTAISAYVLARSGATDQAISTLAEAILRIPGPHPEGDQDVLFAFAHISGTALVHNEPHHAPLAPSPALAATLLPHDHESLFV